ncbi:hypothetical protein JET18_08580 [Chryseobacterium sp. L7]|uniref:DUF4259 domain-containing protein n=1 Tax=Chryseobacterium endalhagicum TaxID=2797638 RepID=A0ABS1QE54_9FLAO|nr:hypothetical protein [Chryseobacterium endalhagicum]MBL1220890.1 hypothetical protein [Chryseobacterium endalhagicum]
MGAWNTGILDNDAAMDLYGFFENLYNQQHLDIETVKKETVSEFGLLDKNGNPVFGSDYWLAYAQICWECKALDQETIAIVQKILDEKDRIKSSWAELADERIQEIEALLTKIQHPAKRKKTIRKTYRVDVPFKIGDCILVKTETGLYSVVVLLDIDKTNTDPNIWGYFIGTTRIYQEARPTMKEVMESHFLVVNYAKNPEGKPAGWVNKPTVWINGNFVGTVKNEKQKQEKEAELAEYEIIGNLQLMSKPELPKSYGVFYLDESYQLESQTHWERENPDSKDLSYPVKKYIG